MSEVHGKEGAGSEPKKLQAEFPIAETKVRLEVEKLHAEIGEIHSRTTGLFATLSRLRGVVGLGVAILSLGAGGAGLYFGYVDFSTRSENEVDRQARQLDFKIGREVIELSMNLSSSDKTERTNAAILLSAYEEHSVPILIANLRTRDEALAESIIRSLGLILDKPRIRDKPDLVIRPLIEEAEALFTDELQQDKPNKLAMIYFVGAFGELFAKTENKSVLDTLDSLDDQITEAQKDENLKTILETVAVKIIEARNAVTEK